MTDEEMKNSLERHKLWQSGFDAGFKAGYKSPRDWTPCAEGMPTNSARYKVTLQVGSEAGTWLETAIIPYRYCDGTGEWILPKSDWMIYGVIAWTKADEPYRADDTTGKVKEDEFMREAMYDQLHSNGN